MSESWATLMGSIRYGFAPYYVLKIAGIPTLFLEVTGDAVAPSGYDLSPTLVIDKSSRVGAQPNDKNGIFSGFDLECALLSDSTTDPYFTRPTARSALSSDITSSDTSIPVTSTMGLTTATHLYFGNQTVAYSGNTREAFVSLTRDTYQSPRSAKAGTVIADAPITWLDREVTLYLVAMDPSGAYVQTANILDTACVVWVGHIQERPIRDQGIWRFTARDQARRLSQPLGAAGNGKVTFTFDDDSPRYIDNEAVFSFKIRHSSAGADTTLGEYSMRPFTGLTNPVRPSKLREKLQEHWNTIAAPDADLGTMIWALMPSERDPLARRWVPTIEVTSPSASGLLWFTVRMEGGAPSNFDLSSGGNDSLWGVVNTTDRYRLPMAIATSVTRAGIAVVVEDGDPANLPTSGFVRLEGNGQSVLLEYDAFTVDAVDGTTVHLSIVDMTDLDWRGQLSPDEDPIEYSATFLFSASGSIETVSRTIIVSTGDAENGTFDTLPKGAGYGIANIDSDSFPDVFDGAFDGITLNLTAEAGGSLAEQLGGILRLSQRALVGRRASDGSAVSITAVHVGSPDNGAPSVTITDDDLVSLGANPVRVVSLFDSPQIIKIDCKTSPDGTSEEVSERLTIRSDWLSDWTQTQWDLKVYGIPRSVLIAPAQVWGLGIMRGAENRQLIEVDVAPWHDVQVGDNVLVSLKSANLWDYATGSRGVTSLARCLGAQVSLDRGIQTLTLMVDGIWGGRPMSPSLPIVAVNGSATAPTSIDLAVDYLTLMQAVAAYGSFTMKAYKPGEDAGLSDYTISGVALSGGLTRLTVSAYPTSPTITLTTDYRVTFPVVSVSTASGNEVQLRHLHNTDITQWS